MTNERESSPLGKRHREQAMGGFTFVEAIVTAVILGILAAVAIPVYTGFVHTQRVDTVKSLGQMAAASANIYFRRTNTTPACGTTAACVTLLGLFVSDPAQFQIQIVGNTVTVKDLYHLDVPLQTVPF